MAPHTRMTIPRKHTHVKQKTASTSVDVESPEPPSAVQGAVTRCGRRGVSGGPSAVSDPAAPPLGLRPKELKAGSPRHATHPRSQQLCSNS